MLAYMSVVPEKSPILDLINEDFEASMVGDIPHLNNKIRSIKTRSFKIVAAYVVLRSFPICVMFATYAVRNLLCSLCKGMLSREVAAQAVAASLFFATVNAGGTVPAIRKQNVAIILSEKATY